MDGPEPSSPVTFSLEENDIFSALIDDDVDCGKTKLNIHAREYVPSVDLENCSIEQFLLVVTKRDAPKPPVQSSLDKFLDKRVQEENYARYYPHVERLAEKLVARILKYLSMTQNNEPFPVAEVGKYLSKKPNILVFFENLGLSPEGLFLELFKIMKTDEKLLYDNKYRGNLKVFWLSTEEADKLFAHLALQPTPPVLSIPKASILPPPAPPMYVPNVPPMSTEQLAADVADIILASSEPVYASSIVQMVADMGILDPMPMASAAIDILCRDFRFVYDDTYSLEQVVFHTAAQFCEIDSTMNISDVLMVNISVLRYMYRQVKQAATNYMLHVHNKSDFNISHIEAALSKLNAPPSALAQVNIYLTIDDMRMYATRLFEIMQKDVVSFIYNPTAIFNIPGIGQIRGSFGMSPANLAKMSRVSSTVKPKIDVPPAGLPLNAPPSSQISQAIKATRKAASLAAAKQAEQAPPADPATDWFQFSATAKGKANNFKKLAAALTASAPAATTTPVVVAPLPASAVTAKEFTPASVLAARAEKESSASSGTSTPSNDVPASAVDESTAVSDAPAEEDEANVEEKTSSSMEESNTAPVVIQDEAGSTDVDAVAGGETTAAVNQQSESEAVANSAVDAADVSSRDESTPATHSPTSDPAVAEDLTTHLPESVPTETFNITVESSSDASTAVVEIVIAGDVSNDSTTSGDAEQTVTDHK